MDAVESLLVWVSPTEAAEALGLSPRGLRYRAGNGEVERRGRGRSTEYRVSASLLRRAPERLPDALPPAAAAMRTAGSAAGNDRHEAQAPTPPASAPLGSPATDAASMNLADQVERLARTVGRLEVELEQTRAELEHARQAPTVRVSAGNASAAEEARIARQSRAQVVEWLQRRGLWDAYLDDVFAEH